MEHTTVARMSCILHLLRYATSYFIFQTHLRQFPVAFLARSHQTDFRFRAFEKYPVPNIAHNQAAACVLPATHLREGKFKGIKTLFVLNRKWSEQERPDAIGLCRTTSAAQRITQSGGLSLPNGRPLSRQITRQRRLRGPRAGILPVVRIPASRQMLQNLLQGLKSGEVPCGRLTGLDQMGTCTWVLRADSKRGLFLRVSHSRKARASPGAKALDISPPGKELLHTILSSACACEERGCI